MTEHPRSERDLAAMVLLMADPVVHPRKAPGVLSVELPDRLQKQRLPGSTNLPGPRPWYTDPWPPSLKPTIHTIHDA
jgi:hypothetical protein